MDKIGKTTHSLTQSQLDKGGRSCSAKKYLFLILKGNSPVERWEDMGKDGICKCVLHHDFQVRTVDKSARISKVKLK